MTVRLQRDPFRPGDVLDAFVEGLDAEAGAVVSFTGFVRAEAGAVDTLTLEAYAGFTEAEIARAEADARSRFDLKDCLILHRHGDLKPGEAIVFVAAAAAHRRAAFQGADHLMDYLKTGAPLWKKSEGPAGAHWIEPTVSDHADAARWNVAPSGQDAG